MDTDIDIDMDVDMDIEGWKPRRMKFGCVIPVPSTTALFSLGKKAVTTMLVVMP